MGTSASFARKALLCLAAALLAFTLVPAGAFARENNDVVSPSVGETQEVSSNQADEAAEASPRRVVAESQGLSAPLALPDLGSTPAASSAEAGTLAASLMGRPVSFVNADVALDGEPVIGSFTVDRLTFAVIDGLSVELVGVSNPEAIGSTPAASETETDGSVLVLPESIAYNDVEYAVTSIGAYAFYLSGVTSVELSGSMIDVDERAFRSSDVASVTVAETNPSYSSFDGALYNADQSSLLLIPEGKQGAVLLPKEAEVAQASKFSHCSLVDAISAEDGAAFASENGLLYTADLTTLLRVPAGATEIAIREGCTTIAAGAMEGCAQLATINAPASVTSISPDVFTSIPTVSLPVVSVADDGVEGEASNSASTQLTALVALSMADDDLSTTNPTAVTVRLPEGGMEQPWNAFGFQIEQLRPEPALDADMLDDGPTATLKKAGVARAEFADAGIPVTINPNGGTVRGSGFASGTYTSTFSFRCHIAFQIGSGAGFSYYTAVGPSNDRYHYSGGWGGLRAGYTFSRWTGTYTVASSTYLHSGTLASLPGSVSLVMNWTPNTYTIMFNPQGGSAVASTKATYDANVKLPVPTRQGYIFKGWNTKADGSGTNYQAGISLTKPNLATSGTVTLYAQWSLAISADVPLEVTAQVDLLGIEVQQEAQGYIESRCGEPLTVTSIELTPLAGATELFGAGNVADVALEVLPDGSATPSARFALDASASQAPAMPAAFRMASYGDRVPISYRFDIPDVLLPTLVEATKPVCSVAYTVKLA